MLVHDPANGATAAIDAPEAAPVEAALKATGWKLSDILVTHHHADHTGGIAELKDRHKCRVVAPKAEAGKIPLVDETVCEGDEVSVGTLAANVIETPGHTAGHITYWFHGDRLAFAGDTLFSIGCGRVIEGTPEMMWASLKKLRDLPGDTKVYCGHEYTLANIKFAQTIEPGNAALQARAAQAAKQIAGKQWTIPDHDRRREGRQSVPARRRARGRRRGRSRRQVRRRSFRRDQGAEEQVLSPRRVQQRHTLGVMRGLDPRIHDECQRTECLTCSTRCDPT